MKETFTFQQRKHFFFLQLIKDFHNMTKKKNIRNKLFVIKKKTKNNIELLLIKILIKINIILVLKIY